MQGYEKYIWKLFSHLIRHIIELCALLTPIIDIEWTWRARLHPTDSVPSVNPARTTSFIVLLLIWISRAFSPPLLLLPAGIEAVPIPGRDSPVTGSWTRWPSTPIAPDTDKVKVLVVKSFFVGVSVIDVGHGAGDQDLEINQEKRGKILNLVLSDLVRI